MSEKFRYEVRWRDGNLEPMSLYYSGPGGAEQHVATISRGVDGEQIAKMLNDRDSYREAVFNIRKKVHSINRPRFPKKFRIDLRDYCDEVLGDD